MILKTIYFVLLNFLFTSSSASPIVRTLQSSNIDLTTCEPNTAFEYSIQLVDMGDSPTDARFVDAFQKAAERWQKVIVGDLPGFPAGSVGDWFQGAFSRPYNGAVDDLVIGYEVSPQWDGVGGTLGLAGGIFVRNRGSSAGTTISGIMRFDQDDFDLMADDDIKSIILHEMGHVLGLVGTNGACTRACDPNNQFQRATYECALANAEYEALAPGNLFLENNGGMGTACGHWDEAVFRTSESSELMTGFFEANLFQPLSLVTVAALDDIGGYEVDYCGADIWPANADTIQRFEVFRTTQEMNPEGSMQTPGAPIGIDEDGNMASSTSTVLTFSVISYTVISFVLNMSIFF